MPKRWGRKKVFSVSCWEIFLAELYESKRGRKKKKICKISILIYFARLSSSSFAGKNVYEWVSDKICNDLNNIIL